MIGGCRRFRPIVGSPLNSDSFRHCESGGREYEYDNAASTQGVPLEHRRTPRYSLAVDIEMTDLQSGRQSKGRTTTLSVAGCGVESVERFPQGATLRIQLSHQGKVVRATGRVVYSTPALGMGMAFTTVQGEDEPILQWWIKEYLSIPVP